MAKDRHLAVLDLDRNGSREVLEQYQLGNNFLVIVPRSGKGDQPLRAALDLPADKILKTLSRADLFLVSPHLLPADFDLLLDRMEQGCHVHLVEQLDLPGTCPPRVRPYLVYCGVWGIISSHDHPKDAEQSCSDYLNRESVGRTDPEPAVYKWDGTEWQVSEALRFH